MTRGVLSLKKFGKKRGSQNLTRRIYLIKANKLRSRLNEAEKGRRRKRGRKNVMKKLLGGSIEHTRTFCPMAHSLFSPRYKYARLHVRHGNN